MSRALTLRQGHFVLNALQDQQTKKCFFCLTNYVHFVHLLMILCDCADRDISKAIVFVLVHIRSFITIKVKHS